jgi:hypothetical protein
MSRTDLNHHIGNRLALPDISGDQLGDDVQESELKDAVSIVERHKACGSPTLFGWSFLPTILPG